MFADYTVLECDFPLPAALNDALEYQNTASGIDSPVQSAPSSPQHLPPMVIDLPCIDTEPLKTNDSTSIGNTSLNASALDSNLSQPIKGKRKRSDKDNAASQQRRRNRRANMPPTERHARKKEREAPDTITTPLDCAADLPVASTGFTGKCEPSLKPGAHWTIEELRDLGYEEIAWDGKQVF